MLPPSDKLAICFAHVAYQLQERFSALETGINAFAAREPGTLENRVAEADVLVISGLWHDGLLDRARKLRFIRRSAPALTSSRVRSWRSAASAWPARTASTTAQSPSTRWRLSSH